MKLICQEDDCAPDAYEYFAKEFEKHVGTSLITWKLSSEPFEDEDMISYQDDNWRLEIGADDPYWKLYSLNS